MVNAVVQGVVVTLQWTSILSMGRVENSTYPLMLIEKPDIRTGSGAIRLENYADFTLNLTLLTGHFLLV